MAEEVKLVNQKELNVKSTRTSFKVESAYDKIKKDVIQSIKRDGGKFVIFDNGAEGLLLCGRERKDVTFILGDETIKEDVLDYIVLTPNRELDNANADVDKYKINHNLSNDYSVLLYLLKHDKAALLDKVNYLLDKANITPFTELGIKLQKKKSDSYSNKKKGQMHYKNQRTKNRNTYRK